MLCVVCCVSNVQVTTADVGRNQLDNHAVIDCLALRVNHCRLQHIEKAREVESDRELAELTGGQVVVCCWAAVCRT